MPPSPIPPGTISTTVSAGTLLAAALGAFQGHPGWLCLALGIVALVAIARGAIEAWKAKGAAVLLAILLAAPAHADGEQPRVVTALPVAPVPSQAQQAAVNAVPPVACVPDPKPVPAWANYIGWALAAATESVTLAVTISQSYPGK